MTKPPVKKLTPDEVEALLTKLEASQDLGDDDRVVLAGIVRTWAHLAECMQHGTLSQRHLQRIFGILARRKVGHKGGGGSSNEPTSSSSNEGDGAPPSSDSGQSAQGLDDDEQKSAESHRDRHGRRDQEAFGELAERHHRHGDLQRGCRCPSCERGRLYEEEPGHFTSITGQAPLVGMTHVVERLRCNLCKQVFTAPLSEELKRDGVSGLRLYSYSAAAVVVVFRFFGGMPMYRQKTMQDALGVAVPDASMFDMCERMADAARPVERHLRRLAQGAKGFFGDDTSALILESRAELKQQRKTGVVVERTGCHTSCVIAVTAEGYKIAIFCTGIQHTGELMDELLLGRDPTLPVPFFMSDCQSSNSVTVARVLYAGCNAHAVRRFKDIEERYPEEAGYAHERYRAIFDNEKKCQQANLDDDERLAYHREHSKPLFDEIFEHGDTLLETRAIEPNSDLGEAYGFVVNNRVRLSAFLRIPGAPLENNSTERILRVPVRLRDNAPFFRTKLGAKISDPLWTVGTTALAYGVNLLDYFVALQRHAADVRARPQLWAPWAYHKREMALLDNMSSPLPQADPKLVTKGYAIALN